MWQDILAVDSKVCQLRPIMAQDKELRPLYLKRRLQLLQEQQRNSLPATTSPNGGGPIRNKKYLSLRVKLLKRQFGLPSDVLSLRSLSLSNATGPVSVDHLNDNIADEPFVEPTKKDSSYNGVHYIFDQHRLDITRLKFLHSDDSHFVCSSKDGTLSLCDLDSFSHDLLCGHIAEVTDFDISESNQFLVSGDKSGMVILWDLQRKSQLRALSVHKESECPAQSLAFSRFLPRNNNLIVCGVTTRSQSPLSAGSGSVRLMNISTGKFAQEGGSPPLLGQALCVEISLTGLCLWVGNDRGHVESFRLGEGMKVHKGSRVSVGSHGQSKPVVSMSVRASMAFPPAATAATPASQKQGPVLLVNLKGSSALHLFKIKDDFGSVEPFMSFESTSNPSLRSASALWCSAFAPILSFREGVKVVSGADDGSLVFFDLDKASKTTSVSSASCVSNKLLGHSQPVVALGFSTSENFLASADSSGQIIVWKK